MYMLKLACMGAFLLMAVLAAHAADRRGWGLRGGAAAALPDSAAGLSDGGQRPRDRRAQRCCSSPR
ncbi:MAG: hypothetical protein ACLUMK_12830 [Christensenellales bacterium]